MLKKKVQIGRKMDEITVGEKLSITDDFYELEFEKDETVNMFYALCRN